MKKQTVSINTYHYYMLEAIHALKKSLFFLNESKKRNYDDLEGGILFNNALIFSRYAFLSSFNALEAAANAFLLNLEISHSLSDDFERLPILTKFDVVCIAYGKRLDRGNSNFGHIKNIVHSRNELVHPKPNKITIEQNEKDIEEMFNDIQIKKGKYPTAFHLFHPKHALNAISDILKFVSWLTYDILKLEIKEGALLIGFGLYRGTGELIKMADEYKFDIRTFCVEKAKVYKIKLE